MALVTDAHTDVIGRDIWGHSALLVAVDSGFSDGASYSATRVGRRQRHGQLRYGTSDTRGKVGVVEECLADVRVHVNARQHAGNSALLRTDDHGKKPLVAAAVGDSSTLLTLFLLMPTRTRMRATKKKTWHCC